MDNNTSILLVEGQADVDFFEALLRRLKITIKSGVPLHSFMPLITNYFRKICFITL